MPAEPVIHRVAPGAAGNEGLVAQIVALTNAVYAVAEAGFWRPGTQRTHPTEIVAAIAAGQVLIEVVTPTGAPSASKAGLGRWYESLGYGHSGRAELAAHYPGLEADLAIGCHLEIYRKHLAADPTSAVASTT